MYGLAKLGFTQSYSYFTWRTAKWRSRLFGRQIAEHADYARPICSSTPPTSLHESLQVGGPGMFAIRAVLAATLGTSWGVYSGFELFEHLPVREGSEEYLNSEKYELRPRDFEGAWPGAFAGAVPEAAQRDSPGPSGAVPMRTITFHHVDNDALLAYSKFDPVTVTRCWWWSPSTRSARRGNGVAGHGRFGYAALRPVLGSGRDSGEEYNGARRTTCGFERRGRWRTC